MAETEIIETTALARLEPQELLAKAIEKGSDIATIERFVALAERVHAIQAKNAYLAAMAEFKQKCPPIVKSKVAKMSKYSYKYPALGDVADDIDPVLGECGLSYRWETKAITPTEVTVVCIIAHRMGHEQPSGDFTLPILGATQRNDGTGEGGANAMQRVGISIAYAERYSLMASLGLAAKDTDGHEKTGEGSDRQEGEGQDAGGDVAVISEPQEKRLWAIARGQAWDQNDVKALLTKYGIASSKEIPRSKYEEIVDKIKAEKKAAPTS